jgi:hypothetical protein
MIATPGDYGEYRRVRLARGLDERVGAAWEYVKRYPDGRFALRLKRYLDRAEPLLFRVRSRSIPGLEAYLRALPDGPHAREALELITVLREEGRREALDIRMARETSARIDAVERRRRAAVESVTWWTLALIDPPLWRRSLSEAPPEFLVRFRLALPQPVCLPDDEEPGIMRCGKPIEEPFQVPGKRRRQDRVLALDVELTLARGYRLERAVLSGPALFVRTQEAQERVALDARKAEVRRAAAARFVAALTKSLFTKDLECNGGTDDSGVTLLVCDDLQLTIDPGSGRDSDAIIIERAPKPASPEGAP